MSGVKGRSGRKGHNPPLKLRAFRLTDEQIKILRIWGRGDASTGLRWLISQAQKLICRFEDLPQTVLSADMASRIEQAVAQIQSQPGHPHNNAQSLVHHIQDTDSSAQLGEHTGSDPQS